jgi:uronate dehydrogenase
MQRVLITGAAGRIGATLRAGLRGKVRHLRLNDIRPLVAEHEAEEIAVADLHDPEAALAATRDVDCIVHLAGVPVEDAWAPVLRNNIEACFAVFEAARINRVKRVVFASTNHVIGFYPSNADVDAVAMPRPDSRYGVSKVFGEALGRLYADKHGLEVACLRIGSFREAPENPRQLATWISPRDMTSLVWRCIAAERFGFIVIYGVSANARVRWHDRDRALIGWRPEDDAEQYAARFAAERSDNGPAGRFHGGEYCAREYSRKQP